MREISNQHAGKKVRIKGIIPMYDNGVDNGDYMVGCGDHTGVIKGIVGDGKFLFVNDHNDCCRLSVKMWRIAEIIE